MRVGAEVPVFLGVRLNAEQDPLAVPDEPDRIHLRPAGGVDRGQMTERGAFEDVGIAIGYRAAGHSAYLSIDFEKSSGFHPGTKFVIV